MNTKQVLINYLRDPDYYNLLQLLKLPLTNEEIIEEIGLIEFDSKNKWEVDSIHGLNLLFEYLEQNTHRLYAFSLDSLVGMFTHQEGVYIHVGKNTRLEYAKLLTQYLYNQNVCSKYTLHALVIIQEEGDEDCINSVYTKGLLPQHITTLVKECWYRGSSSLLVYLEKSINKPCHLLTDIKTVYRLIKNPEVLDTNTYPY